MKQMAYSGVLIAGLVFAANVWADSDAVSTDTGQTSAPHIATRLNKIVSADDGAGANSFQQRLVVAQAADVDEQIQKANEELERAKPQFEKAQAEYARNMALFDGASGGTFNLISGRPAERALVIRSSETDSKTLGAAEEDMNIMGRILEKALAQGSEDEEHQAMGIKLLTIGGPSSAKNLMIEGYGAIFMLNVNFPLVGPPSKPEENDEKQPTNSAWDETKRELYGHSTGARGGGGHKVEFDAKRVEKLKSSLIGALKNASNIRSLKSDENVTLVVTSVSGGQAMGQFSYKFEPKPNRFPSGGGGGGGGGSSAGSSSGSSGGGGFGGGPFGEPVVRMSASGSGGGPVLTIRARKSDIDAFAKGKLTMDEFRNKAGVLIY